MAFRSEKAIGALMLLAFAAGAAEYPAKQVRLRRDVAGTLTVDVNGMAFGDVRWRWNDLQRVVLAPRRIEITTYEDVKWQMGRDRTMAFTGGDFSGAYAVLRANLPRRLVTRIAQPVEAVTDLPAKLLGGREGTLRLGRDRIVFEAGKSDGSYTWILPDIDNVSTSDPLEFVISSLGVEYRFQLKQPLPERVYDELWRHLNTRRTN